MRGGGGGGGGGKNWIESSSTLPQLAACIMQKSLLLCCGLRNLKSLLLMLWRSKSLQSEVQHRDVTADCRRLKTSQNAVNITT